MRWLFLEHKGSTEDKDFVATLENTWPNLKFQNIEKATPKPSPRRFIASTLKSSIFPMAHQPLKKSTLQVFIKTKFQTSMRYWRITLKNGRELIQWKKWLKMQCERKDKSLIKKVISCSRRKKGWLNLQEILRRICWKERASRRMCRSILKMLENSLISSGKSRWQSMITTLIRSIAS